MNETRRQRKKALAVSCLYLVMYSEMIQFQWVVSGHDLQNHATQFNLKPAAYLLSISRKALHICSGSVVICNPFFKHGSHTPLYLSLPFSSWLCYVVLRRPLACKVKRGNSPWPAWDRSWNSRLLWCHAGTCLKWDPDNLHDDFIQFVFEVSRCHTKFFALVPVSSCNNGRW